MGSKEPLPVSSAFATGERFAAAFALAAEAHAGQYRKGTAIPYISHPLEVASLVLKFGGSEDLAIAALLHDVIEDGGARYAFIIREKFGEYVARLVRACTDGTSDQAGVKPPWHERKQKHLAHLGDAESDVLLIVGCDKLANAQDILNDLNEVGISVFDRFSVSRYQTLWFYRQITDLCLERGVPVAARLAATVAKIETAVAKFN